MPDPSPVSSTPPEEVAEAPPATSPSWWVVYLSDPGCALREADRDPDHKVKVDLEAAEDLTHPSDADHLPGLAKADIAKLKAAVTAAIVDGPAQGGTLEQVLAAQQVAGSMAAACHGYVYDPDSSWSSAPSTGSGRFSARGTGRASTHCRAPPTTSPRWTRRPPTA